MEVAIRGYGNREQLLKQLRENKDIHVRYAIDNNKSLWGKIRNGLEYISPMKACCLYEKGEIEKIFINSYFTLPTIEKIVKEMQDMGIKEKDICIPSVRALEEIKIAVEDIEKGTYMFKQLKRLHILQYHIADHCNLNCKGCNHFSPLVKDKQFPNLESIMLDLQRIHEVVDDIDWIAILGGEPLLNPNWKEYAKETRKIWKYSYISIFTNGLLVRRLTEDDIAFLKEWDISLVISLYKVNWDFIDKIVQELERKGVKCDINMEDGPICEFTSSFNLESTEDYRIKRKKCTQDCTCIRNGKMTPCAPMMFVDIFNEYFQTQLPAEKAVDIYGETFSFEELNKGLRKPMELCRYCDMSSMKKWENANLQEGMMSIEDWLV